jgi:16S rRNA (guanine(966)-N(2))-methyltransferase RsmD
VRVISGKAKGSKLQSVPGEGTRPIMDRVKEALFNIIGADIQGASLWDLFGGTGSVGIEALSRGAAYVRFVDKSQAAVKTIQANLTATRLAGENAEVIRADSLAYLRREPDRHFEYMYLAPPQYKMLWQDTLLALDAHPGWLTPDAWVIVQIHPLEYKPMVLEKLIEFDQRRYGSTLLVFFEPPEV